MEPSIKTEMSVMDVLKENVRILNGMRIPVSEREIWNAVMGVTQNTQLCIDAMERAEAEAKDKKLAEGQGHAGEETGNIIQLNDAEEQK